MVVLVAQLALRITQEGVVEQAPLELLQPVVVMGETVLYLLFPAHQHLMLAAAVAEDTKEVQLHLEEQAGAETAPITELMEQGLE